MTNPARHLVVGAAGRVGRQLCRRLVGSGDDVRALVRRTADPAIIEMLRQWGVEVVEGDLTAPRSLAAACAGVTTVTSTATAIATPAGSDALDRVDRDGHVDLIDAATSAGVDRFVFVSFAHSPFASPFQDAKRAVEDSLRASPLHATVLHPGAFMDVWFSPPFGFDTAHATVTVLGTGDAPVNFITVADVAAIADVVLHTPETAGETIEFSGDHLTWNQVVRRFQTATRRALDVTRVPLVELQRQFSEASDPIARSYTALGLMMAVGDPIDHRTSCYRFGLTPIPVAEYARQPSASK